MKFTKMQGCGNDYIYVNCFTEKVEDASRLSIRISDRHCGIGGDGLVLICPSEKADFMMDIYNMDGSRAKMCGNAIRCVGKYVYEHGMTAKTELAIDTLSGIKHLKLITEPGSGAVTAVTVDMGAPNTVPNLIPIDINELDKLGAEELISLGPTGNAVIRELPVEASDRTFNFTCVSMGNPHAVTFVKDTAAIEIERYGPLIENHPLFPERVNIEFAQIIDRSTVKMRVWERGSNETRACGTGACATAYACIVNGLTDDEVCVRMPGGNLTIRYDRNEDKIYMTGPATEVFRGEIEERV